MTDNKPDICSSKLLELIRKHMESGKPDRTKNVFTLSGMPGAGSTEIARIMAKKLDLKIYNKEFIRDFSEFMGINRSAFDLVSEEKGDAKDFWLYRIFGGGEVTNEKIRQHLDKFFYALASMGNCIVVGRGGHVALKDVATLRVHIVCEKDVSIKRIMKRNSVSYQEAEQRYKKALASAGRFVWNIYNSRLNEAINFDVVINTTKLDDPEYVADMLIEAAQRRNFGVF
ncbi:MAG: cytidylate kinase-like family protein [Alphaproteobacteria bacterium]|nr:cytidylate kinase-like family protein [Alphaproteobacteria bacterium]